MTRWYSAMNTELRDLERIDKFLMEVNQKTPTK